MTERLKRTIGVVAHVDAGKTTLTERILLKTGRISRAGEVHDGAATMDSGALEKAHGVTISAAAAAVDWRGARIMLVDTPGHVDFTSEVARAMRAIDGAVVLLSGVSGVEPQTEAVWAEADRWATPRIAFVNKMDAAGADYAATLAAMAARLSIRPVAVAWPLVASDRLVGIVDLVDGVAWRWSDDGAPERCAAPETPELIDARARLIEAAVETDDAALAVWLDDPDAIGADRLRALLRAATAARRLVPTLCGAAYRGVGVEPLLDAVLAYLPSAAERGAVDGVGPDGPETRAPVPDAPAAALVVKIAPSRFGEAAWLRILSGRVAPGDALVAGDTRLRVGRLYAMVADRLDPIDAAEPGDIVAAVGLRGVAAGDTLSAPSAPFAIEGVRAPEPVIEAAIEPVRAEDRDRLETALRRRARGDGGLKVGSDPETGQLLVKGAGELHLALVAEALQVEDGIDARLGAPRVAYREALGGPVEIAHRLKRQNGGQGMFAELRIAFEPGAAGAAGATGATGAAGAQGDVGLAFEDATVGGAVPGPYAAAVAKGLAQALEAGGPDGWPILSLRARLLDGAVHAKDSSALAFEVAAREALARAFDAVGARLLEPMAAVEIRCPEDRVGGVVGDLAARRGTVSSSLAEASGDHRIVGRAPLANLAAYVGALRSLTQGRGTVTIRPDGYAPVPAGASVDAARAS